MKVKVFNIGAAELEKEINSWLNANPNVRVQHVNVAQESGQRLIVLVFYQEEELGKNEQLFPELVGE